MQDNDKKTYTILFILYSCTAKKIISGAWHTLASLLTEKMVRNKVRKKENRKQIDLAKSLSSTSRSTQGWEPTGFQAKVDWISVLTGPEKDWKRSVTLQTSLYCRSLGLIEDLSDQFEEREANWREKQASKSGQVEVSLPSSCSTASSELATFFF